MTVTLVVVLLVDLVAVAAIAFLLAPVLAPARSVLEAGVPLGRTYTTLAWWLLVLVPALAVLVWIQLRYARYKLLAAIGARPVGNGDYEELLARVRRLADLAAIEAPAVAVSPSEVPNCCAIGTLTDATLVVSHGLMEVLDDDALNAVLAHELAHVKNRDAIVMTLAAFLPAITYPEPAWHMRRRTVPRGGTLPLVALSMLSALVLASAVIDLPARVLTVFAGLVLLGSIAFLLGDRVLAALGLPIVEVTRPFSRSREIAADEESARLTGDPGGLVRALRTLDAHVDTIRVAGRSGGAESGGIGRSSSRTHSDAAIEPPSRSDRHGGYDGLRSLCLMAHGFDDQIDRARFPVDYRSHPPVEVRIERLQALERAI